MVSVLSLDDNDIVIVYKLSAHNDIVIPAITAELPLYAHIHDNMMTIETVSSGEKTSCEHSNSDSTMS